MRMLMEVKIPNEPFGSLIRQGTVTKRIQDILGEIRPEAVYFTETDGHRGAILVVDLPDPSRIPALAEPFYLAFNAEVHFRVCMTPDDLARTGLEDIGRRYA